jgi:hypothetical protein
MVRISHSALGIDYINLCFTLGNIESLYKSRLKYFDLLQNV